jgi:general secretion pathway protein A
MYLQHFGLQEAPFAITPDPRYLYLSERHREALAHLVYGIGEGGGFVQLTGEVGTGKTTLCRCLLEQLPPNVDVALILNPRLTPQELVAAICDELRVPYPPGGSSLKTLVDALNHYLLDAHGRGRRTVAILDEAQNLDREVLEQVRLLTNLETPRDKLLQIILIGQPELVKHLGRPELRQLSQRITARYHLTPLSRAETRAYIRHRLSVSGAREDIFTGAAMGQVYALSGGIPRLVNVICDRALLGAYALDRRTVDAAGVRKAAAETLGRAVRPLHRSPWVWGTAALAGACALWILWPMEGITVHQPLATADNGRPSVAPPAGTATTVTATTPAAEAVPPQDKPPEPSSQPAAGAAPPQPPAAEEAPASFEQVLAEHASTSDKASAFAELFARWGLRYQDFPGATACERAQSRGLKCSFRNGDWDTLRRVNRPALLEFATLEGEEYYATVTALAGERATLGIDGESYTFAEGELDPYWSGQSIVLWRPPSIGTALIAASTRGAPVRWLRERFERMDGRPLATANPDVYDAALRARVRRFQTDQGLAADGVVGEQTLMALGNAAGALPHPTLSPP